MSMQSLSRECRSISHIGNANSQVSRLSIASQASYIRAALSAGKHVLSEKPVAENVEEAEALIKWYTEEIEPLKKATWSVAENFRYLNSFRYAREKVQGLGKIIGFRVKVYGNIQQDGKFFSNTTI
jgi:predicted dehydrogenase